jgi:hypothetical protein
MAMRSLDHLVRALLKQRRHAEAGRLAVLRLITVPAPHLSMTSSNSRWVAKIPTPRPIKLDRRALINIDAPTNARRNAPMNRPAIEPPMIMARRS